MTDIPSWLTGTPVKLRIVKVSNPYCWYRDKLGEIIEAVWFDMWGCYVVPARTTMHPDDMQLRASDVEIATNPQ